MPGLSQTPLPGITWSKLPSFKADSVDTAATGSQGVLPSMVALETHTNLHVPATDLGHSGTLLLVTGADRHVSG